MLNLTKHELYPTHVLHIYELNTFMSMTNVCLMIQTLK